MKVHEVASIKHEGMKVHYGRLEKGRELNMKVNEVVEKGVGLD